MWSETLYWCGSDVIKQKIKRHKQEEKACLFFLNMKKLPGQC